MSPNDILSLRLYNQHLTSPQSTNPVDLVTHLGAVQSQEYIGAKWAVGQRLIGATNESMDTAFNNGEILRTHVMRPTWHFVAPNDILWMQELTSPRVKRIMEYYNKNLELDKKLFEKTNSLLVKNLKGKSMTRAEIKELLSKIGIEATTQRLAHIVSWAELDGLICSGPMRGKQHTYALVEDRAPHAKRLGHEEALLELTRRYFQSHGPATVKDFVWWSGLLTTDARRGLALLGKSVEHEIVGNKTYWFFRSDIPTMPDGIYLLPTYDENTIAYTERELFYDNKNEDIMGRPGNALFLNAVMHEGKVIAAWRRSFTKKEAIVDLRPFEKFTKFQTNQLQKTAEKYGRFFGLTPRLARS